METPQPEIKPETKTPAKPAAKPPTKPKSPMADFNAVLNAAPKDWLPSLLSKVITRCLKEGMDGKRLVASVESVVKNYR